MKNSRKCPKCQSADIAIIKGQVGAYGTGNNIQMGITNFSAVKVTRFLCTDCGFSEEWVESKADLDKIKKNSSKVNQQYLYSPLGEIAKNLPIK